MFSTRLSLPLWGWFSGADLSVVDKYPVYVSISGQYSVLMFKSRTNFFVNFSWSIIGCFLAPITDLRTLDSISSLWVLLYIWISCTYKNLKKKKKNLASESILRTLSVASEHQATSRGKRKQLLWNCSLLPRSVAAWRCTHDLLPHVAIPPSVLPSQGRRRRENIRFSLGWDLLNAARTSADNWPVVLVWPIAFLKPSLPALRPAAPILAFNALRITS